MTGLDFEPSYVVDSLAGSQTDKAPSVAATNTALAGKSPTSHDHDADYDALGAAAAAQSAAVQRANHTGTQAISTVTGLQAALDAKLATNGDGSGLTGITAAQVGAAATSHTQALTTITGTGMLPGLSRRAVYQPSGAVLVLIGPCGGTPSNYASASSAGHFRQMIFDNNRSIDFSQICVRTAGSIAGTARVAIYEVAASGGPGVLVGQSDSTTVPAVAGLIDMTWTTPASVTAGTIYWVGFKPEHTGTNPTWAGLTSDTGLIMGASFLAAASNTCNPVTGLYKLGMSSGAFPADMTATAMTAHYNTTTPWVGFEI